MKTYTHVIEERTTLNLDHGVGVVGVCFTLRRVLGLDPAQPICVGDFVTVEHDGKKRVFEINKIEHGPGGTTLKSVGKWSWEYSRENKESLYMAYDEALKFEAMGYDLDIDDVDGDLDKRKAA